MRLIMKTTLPESRAPRSLDVEEVELSLLMEGIFQLHGFDFRDYSYPSLKRRVMKRVYGENLTSISALQEKVFRDPACMERLLLDLSVNVTAMFRDPTFYAAFRAQVVPLLRTYPFVRVWHAGCSTGEEVYSMAILLQEEGLYDRCRIYATDMNEPVLDKARKGIIPLASMKENTANYLAGGGAASFSDYYTANYDSAIFHPSLTRNVVFAQHNLAIDGSFNLFNVIFCRNVMIYFNQQLQERVLGLFHESLGTFGILGLGKKESLKYTSFASSYEELNEVERIYRRIR